MDKIKWKRTSLGGLENKDFGESLKIDFAIEKDKSGYCLFVFSGIEHVTHKMKKLSSAKTVANLLRNG